MSDYGAALCASAALLWVVVLLDPSGFQAYVRKPWFRDCVLLTQRAVKLVGCLLSVGTVPEQYADQALCGYYGMTAGQYIYMSWQSSVTVVSPRLQVAACVLEWVVSLHVTAAFKASYPRVAAQSPAWPSPLVASFSFCAVVLVPVVVALLVDGLHQRQYRQYRQRFGCHSPGHLGQLNQPAPRAVPEQPERRHGSHQLKLGILRHCNATDLAEPAGQPAGQPEHGRTAASLPAASLQGRQMSELPGELPMEEQVADRQTAAAVQVLNPLHLPPSQPDDFGGGDHATGSCESGDNSDHISSALSALSAYRAAPPPTTARSGELHPSIIADMTAAAPFGVSATDDEAGVLGNLLPRRDSGPAAADMLQFLMPKLADLLGLEAALDVARYAPGSAGEPAASIAAYEGHCRMDVASIKVAAAHSDIATLGPLLHSSLLSALHSDCSAEGLSGSPEVPVCQSVAIEGCVHLLAMVLSPKPLLCSAGISDTSLESEQRSFAVKLLHTVLQDMQTSYFNSGQSPADDGSVAQVSILWCPAGSPAKGVHSSSNEEPAYDDSTAVASNTPRPRQVASWCGSHFVVAAGDSCVTDKVLANSSSSSLDAGGSRAGKSLLCRLLVFRDQALLLDQLVQPGVVYLVLLPAEGPLQYQVQPLVCQPMMVLPAAAAAEMQQLLLYPFFQLKSSGSCRELHRPWRNAHESLTAVATDMAFVLDRARAPTQSWGTWPLVLHRLACFLVTRKCFHTLGFLLHAVPRQP
eukprot:gene12837-12965_t